MIVFKYIPRFELTFISKNANDWIKKEYSEIIAKFFHNKEVVLSEKNIDIEDWIESIYPLISLNKYNLLDKVIIEIKNKESLSINNIKINPEDKIIIFGMIRAREIDLSNDILFPLVYQEDIDKVEEYYKLNTFKKYSKRWYEIATYYTSEFKEYLTRINEIEYFKKESLLSKLEKISKEMIEDEKKIFIKTVSKWFHLKINLLKNDKDIFGKILSKIGYNCERIPPTKDNFLIQEFVKMRYEYRFLVINNKLVSGAGCLEELTPADSDGLKFDLKVQEFRNKSEYVKDSNLIDKYVDFANLVINSLKENNEELKHYTLDVALNKKNEVVIVEFNPYTNIGFYAMKHDEIIKNLILEYGI